MLDVIPGLEVIADGVYKIYDTSIPLAPGMVFTFWQYYMFLMLGVLMWYSIFPRKEKKG